MEREATGPRGVPFFGNVLEAWRDPIGLMMRGLRDHGDLVRFRFGPYRYYMVNDPDAIKHVLVDNHKTYQKSRNYKALKLLLGDGLLTSEGEFWRRQRKLAQPAFHRERLAAFADTMVAYTDAMLTRWAAHPGASTSMDVHDEMMRLTFRIVGKTLFSTDVEGDADVVGPALSVATHFTEDYAQAVIPTPLWIPTPANVRFRRAKRALDAIVFRIIDERRKGASAAGDLLSMLMAVTDEETGERMDDRQLRDEVMTLVLAGHETTANALSWTFMLLSQHPDVERRLHAEVAAALGDRAPRLEDLPKLTYCANVVSEALRLYPPAWAFERQAIADDTILGCRVPKGSMVGISPYVVHRHPAHWDNPLGFDPDRFTPARSEGRPRYAYLPFGGGPRMCIGNAFALMEAQLVVARVVQRYRVDLLPGHPVELDPVVTLRPKNGIHVTLTQQHSGPAGAPSNGEDPTLPREAPAPPSPAPVRSTRPVSPGPGEPARSLR
jgi:cytochrome P450